MATSKAAATFTCGTCGQQHEGPASAFAVKAPTYWEQLGWLDKRGSNLGDETCVIRNRHFFVRGLLELPVKGRKTPFVWNVWSSIDLEDFRTMLEHWTNADRAKDPPYAGQLANDLAAVYPSTLNLKLKVHTAALGHRPTFELDPADHPLALEQSSGITPDRVREINSLLLHPAKISR